MPVSTLTKNDVEQITTKVIQVALEPLRKDLKTVKNDIRKIRKDQNTIINFFDKKNLEIEDRLEKIEQTIAVSPS